MYIPSADWATYIGTIGLFLALQFLFIRLLPMISIFEMRELVDAGRRMKVSRCSDRGEGVHA